MVSVCAGIARWSSRSSSASGEYAVALAFVVGLLDADPDVVGSVISAVVVTAIARATISPTVALVCLVFYLVYQQLETYVIYPRVMARTVDVPGR